MGVERLTLTNLARVLYPGAAFVDPKMPVEKRRGLVLRRFQHHPTLLLPKGHPPPGRRLSMPFLSRLNSFRDRVEYCRRAAFFGSL